MEDNDISNLFKGKNVTITSKVWGSRELVSRRGTVVGVNPGVSLRLLQHADPIPVPFCGVGEGIVKIEDQRGGKVLYENSGAQEAYKSRQSTEAQRDALREQGVFYSEGAH